MPFQGDVEGIIKSLDINGDGKTDYEDTLQQN